MRIFWIAALISLLPLCGARAQTLPATVDIMLISTHGDDEGIYGGGVLPYYSRVRGLKVLQLSMTGGDPASDIRVIQLHRAVESYAGVKENSGTTSGDYYLAGNITFRDGGLNDCCGGDAASTSWTNWGGNEAAGRSKASAIVAREIRRFKPKVVLSAHAFTGEYGHSNHKAVAVAAYEGVMRAKDGTDKIDGLSNDAAHTVDFFFMRGSRAENTIALDGVPSNGGLQPFFHDYWERRLLNGSSPRQATNLGLKKHWTEFYLEQQVATVYCGKVDGTNPNSNSNWEYIRDGHPSEQWMLMFQKATTPLPKSTFTIDGEVYQDWARGDFWTTPPDFTSLQSAAPSPANGTDVSVVEYAGGSLENAGCRQWLEFSGSNTPVRTYIEEYPLGKQYASGQYVVLKEKTDTGVKNNSRLLIDLASRTVKSSSDVFDASKVDSWKNDALPTFTLRNTINTVDKRVNGRAVREVTSREGQTFRLNPASKRWEETNVAGNVVYSFRETNRDMWSVYLTDDSRNVHLQIDMHRFWIRYRDGSLSSFRDQYQIVMGR